MRLSHNLALVDRPLSGLRSFGASVRARALARGAILGAACLAAAATGCGDDDGGAKSDSGTVEQGDPCPQQGLTMTDCHCPDSTRPGFRTCDAELQWTPCSCPPGRNDDGGAQCYEGQRVQCDNACEGEDEPGIVRCDADGRFDCSCPRKDPSGGAQDGGAGGADDDAGR